MKNVRALFAGVLLAVLTVLAGCTGVDAKHHAAAELPQLRSIGYRVAVLPFAVTAPADGFLSDSLAPVGELLALEAGGDLPMHDKLGKLVHDDAVAWLRQSEFEVLDPWHVMTQLSHSGLADRDLTDRRNLAAIARAVGADGIVYGDLNRWNRSYYVLQTVVEVGLHLELIDAATAKVLFTTDRVETVGSGLTGGPTGYVSVATEPIAGLKSSTLRNLTRSVTRHAITDLNGGELGSAVDATSPRLTLVALAKDHDGPFRIGERIDVIAIGTPDCDVRFDLGRLRTAVPMKQTERHEDPRGVRATYMGHYIVQAGDRAIDLPVTCTIQRGIARRQVAVRYRWEGTLSLGNVGDGAARAVAATTNAR